MARYLSPEWVTDFNRSLADVVLPSPGPDATLATAGGRFTVVQEIRDSPDGDVRLSLLVDGGSLRVLVNSPADQPGGGEERVEENGVDQRRVDVTIALSYKDASAMSSGELSPAEALNAGRIKVRGDLSVLVATQELLAAARTSTQNAAPTTY